MSGNWRTRILVGLGAAVVIAAIYFPALKSALKPLRKLSGHRRASAPRVDASHSAKFTDHIVKAKLFWASSEDESALAAIERGSWRFPTIRFCARNKF